MTENQTKVRNIVRLVIDKQLTNIVLNEISGRDFVEKVYDKLPIDDDTDVYPLDYNPPSVDEELYNKFLDHLTDISMGKLKVN